MKRLFFSITFLLFFGSITVFSQNPIRKGEAQLNFGAGASVYGVPVYIGVDYGIHEDISVGGILSFRGYREATNVAGTRYYYNHSIFGIGVTGDYHFNNLLNIPREFDVYAGATVGFYIWRTSDIIVAGTNVSYNGSPANVGINPHVGGRYNFNPKWSVHAQVDAGTHSSAMAGLTFKL